MSARINKFAVALASIVLLVAAAPVVTAAESGSAPLACQAVVCGG